MCLFLLNNNSSLKKTTEDIICYKVFFTTQNDTLYSPCMEYPFKINKLHKDKKSVEKRTMYHSSINYAIYGGCFHSFKNYEQAVKYAYEQSIGFDPEQYSKPLKDIAVIKCIIPKNTKYYNGYCDIHTKCPCYGSKSIFITNEILYKTN